MKQLTRSYGQIGRIERSAIEARGLDADLDWFRASTRRLDRHNSIIEPEGFELEDFGGIFGWGHDVYGRFDGSAPPPENVLGHVDAVDQSREFFDIGVRWADTQLARDVKKQIDDGMINGVSVGFIPKEFEWDVLFDADSEVLEQQDESIEDGFMADHFIRQELLEVSVVIIPSNPEGQALALQRCVRAGLPTGMVLPWNAAAPPTPATHPDLAARYRTQARLRLARARLAASR